ncbi:cytochrome c biogenesis protein CcdA [bacterium]|nr:MAG: cytochrome c biogenesis protein CcdA [bacterium]
MHESLVSSVALVYSSSLIAAFLGGVLALFAPCCVVSLMPTFVGAALRSGRLRLPITTTIFAAGVAVVLLPIILGVGALGHVLGIYHRTVYLVVGLLLLALGLAVFVGRGFTLPMPSFRYRAGSAGGIGDTFMLGVVSGVVSSCCAPVLAGVIALSALAASPLGAAGLGISYVFGMVFPLFTAALLWERLNLQQRLASRHWPRITIGGRPVLWTDAASGTIFIAMGSLALTIAITGTSTLTPDALVAWTRWATGIAGALSLALGHLPIIAQAAILLALATGVAAGVVVTTRRAPVETPDPQEVSRR